MLQTHTLRHRYLAIILMIQNNYKAAALLGSLSVLAAISIIWTAANFGFIPQYGDTSEYVALSETLMVDQYRGILYPLLIHIAKNLESVTGFGYFKQIYVFQIMILASSSYAVASCALTGLRRSGNLEISYQQHFVYALLVAVIASMNPLAIHFAVTVLTDSIASSLTLLIIAAFGRALLESRSRRYFALWVLAAAAAIVTLTLLRVEKLYLCIGLIVIFLFLLLLRPRSNPHLSNRYKVLATCVVVAATLLLSSLLRGHTTIDNPTRPPLNLSSLAFNRAVWPRLESIQPHLPKKIRATISLEQARQFDSHANEVFPFVAAALADPNKGPKYLDQITKVAWDRQSIRIIGRTIFDATKYVLPNVAFPLEAIDVLPQSVATSWTISRMGMIFPKLTSVYLAYGSVVPLLLLIVCARSQKSMLAFVRSNIGLLVLASCAIGINAGMFAVSFGMDAHIRYALPTYVLINELVLLALVYSLCLAKRCGPVTLVDRGSLALSPPAHPTSNFKAR